MTNQEFITILKASDDSDRCASPESSKLDCLTQVGSACNGHHLIAVPPRHQAVHSGCCAARQLEQVQIEWALLSVKPSIGLACTHVSAVMSFGGTRSASDVSLPLHTAVATKCMCLC